MSRIQIADLNSSEFGFLYDVNDAEMLAIIGGGWFSKAWKSIKNFFKNATYSVSYSSSNGLNVSIKP
jgi:hypothetical protein